MTNYDRRNFLKLTGASMLSVMAGCSSTKVASTKKRLPNIVFVLADDLGWAELGCYGQKKIKTPNIDKLRTQGMKFTQHYSGNPVCAPSRCSLMTGLHTGHAQIRGNRQVGGAEGWKIGATTGGQWPITADTVTIPKLLKQKGYATGAFGKWGLGIVGSEGDPQKQGFDHFFGYICQRQAHTYYNTHLWDDGKVYQIPENANGQEKVFTHDLIANKSLDFVKKYKDQPFFCYVPFTIPHVSVQCPEDSTKEYLGKFPEKPFPGDSLYVPSETPHATYAAMITRMDGDVGRLMKLIKDLDLENDTIFIFTSDNGSANNGGADLAFFEGVGPLNAFKGSVYEGGIRIPLIVRWPGKVKANSTSDHVSAFWDFLPTFTDVTGVKTPTDIDGISMLPTLTGKGKQKQHDHLYWELGRQQGIRQGDLKAIRIDQGKIKIYNLKNDLGEQNDIADANPDLVAKFEKLFVTARTDSEIFKQPKPKAQ
ncbi:MAG: arylsulfatase [Phycisphaerae bacterium]|nr:arylsulfatase [Phycisphaerae bacterium]